MIHRYALLKTTKIFKVQAVARNWNLSSLQVQKFIKRGFKEFLLESFIYLLVDADALTLDLVQDQDGDMLITSATLKKGTLYIAGPSHVS